ncbi:Transmembrane exosortase (Exosortase_EpsH) [Mucilaginibacter gotjawali]|nr:Transmembrane exosortase (Exosortase_EpsH) [Mucilaginibacter gotjawali]
MALKLRAIQPGYFTTGLVVICLVMFFVVTPFYIVDVNVYLGILLAPYILTVEKGCFSKRLVIPVLALLVLVFFVPVRTVFGLVLIGVVLLMIENSLGRINNPFMFLMLVISPLYKYWSGFIEFPVRLKLTEVTAWLLNFTGAHASAAGNIITLGRAEFSVDPACAGLNMMEVSFFIALFIVAYYQRTTGKPVKSIITAGILLATLALNIVSNLFRIIILVMFSIMPQNPLHEINGLLCMTVYVVIPLLVLIRWVFSRLKVPGLVHDSKVKARANWSVNLFLTGMVIFAGCRVSETPFNRLPDRNYSLPGYHREILPTGVIKFEDKKSLIYFKPTEFYAMGHDPSICWRGSGYEFNVIRQETIKGTMIYIGTMNKGKDLIYSSWWFDNGKCRTINQFDWRWKALKGEGEFSLVNVNAANEQDLRMETQKLLGMKRLL